MNQQDSASGLLATTMLLSLVSVGYIFHYFRQKIDSLENTKQDIDENEATEKNIYQAWSGTFADGTDSLEITLVWKKECSRKKNEKWLDWDGLEDASVINRNFYLGNLDPSFIWAFIPRDNDTKADVKETFTDGWNSIIQLKLTAFIHEPKTNDGMNLYLKDLLVRGEIEWQKCLLSKHEIIEAFG